jgi:chemotaxis protein MotB
MKALWTRSVAVALCMAVGASGVGCGHSEDEWQAELAKEKKLQADFDAEKAAHKKTRDEIKKVSDEVASLKKEVATYEELKKKYGSAKDKNAQLEKALKDAQARADALEAAKRRLEALKKKLDELKKFNLKVAIRHNQIVIEMPGDVLFASGSDLLSKDGKEVLGRVADVIKGDSDLMKRNYQVIGHTDNEPYSGPFRDNVGLSVMRAREVYQFLTTTPDGGKKKEGGGLPADRWSAAGYGELDPIAGSREKQSADERKRNRRIEIAIMPDANELMKLDVD